ncbi:hypothetical protein [Halalkalirubrum salinum]|uniref:hypothetical protein n=1 Tax=Halalkalirubrum salinum TaxID=2563889 RepID=UPI0010FB8838|nr:hypothetical protein [Halalkalirubrum salinum]
MSTQRTTGTHKSDRSRERISSHNTQYLARYTIERVDVTHEEWLVDWLLSWIDCPGVAEVVVDRTRLSEGVQFDVSITIEPVEPFIDHGCPPALVELLESELSRVGGEIEATVLPGG